MAHVNVTTPDLTFDEPMLLDGLPGTGLVGKLVADFAVNEFDMEYYAGVYCEGVAPVGAYRPDSTTVRPPVQIHADDDSDLLALTSDVPVSGSDAPEFARCLTEWLEDNSVTPVFLSGFAEGFGVDDDERELYGLSTGDGDELVDTAGLAPPPYAGIVTGPTGALLNRASDVGLDSTGVLIETDGDIPDYEGAVAAIDHGIEPITGVEMDTGPLEEGSIEMSHVAESAIDRMVGSGDGTSETQPTPTFY